eukprot:TRINITY_DN11972_c0_g1_i3.p1 TRINITY_DN11972_c0_g1~~TRINITY_DN11972_c0_g1_i3.p1  ORF type:complete len:499 (+),score=106.94 TRINITY_DN11972_c0_g1_i3:52-1548(+)
MEELLGLFDDMSESENKSVEGSSVADTDDESLNADADSDGADAAEAEMQSENAEDTHPMPSCSFQDKSTYITAPVAIEVIGAQAKATVYMHQATLDKVPYFTAQQARWSDAGSTLKLQLPEGTHPDHFLLLVNVLYSPKIPIRFSSVTEGHLVTELAVMLACEAEIIDALAFALRSTLRRQADMSQLKKLYGDKEMPAQIQRVVKRRRTMPNEPSFRDLQSMLHTAVVQRDTVMIQCVEKHLKERARRGLSGREQVAKILMSEPSSRVIPPMLEFLSAHPYFYGHCMRTASCLGQWHQRLTDSRFKGLTELLKLGTQHFLASKISEDEFVVTFRVIMRWFDNRLKARTKELKSSICEAVRQSPVSCQVKVIRDVIHDDERFTGHVLFPEFVNSLAWEAKHALVGAMLMLPDDEVSKALREPDLLKAFGKVRRQKICKRILNMDQEDARQTVDVSVLKHLGTHGMQKLLPMASVFAPEVRNLLVASATAALRNDAEDGF